MAYIVLYLAFVASIFWIWRVGWSEALKKIISVLIPSTLIILLNLKAGRIIFRSPFVGVISFLPTAFFVYRFSQPFVTGVNNWIDRKSNNFGDSQEIVDIEVISKEDL